MNDCLFCKLIQDPEQKKLFVYEDSDFVVFPDISQFTKGHLLLIPKTHYRWVWDIPNIGDFFEIARKMSLRLQEKLKCEQVYSLTMGAMVPHAHLHLIPKTEGNWYEVLAEIAELQRNRVPKSELLKLVSKLKG